MKCNICNKKISKKEIYALYPEDTSCICKKCFGNNGYNKNNKDSNLKK